MQKELRNLIAVLIDNDRIGACERSGRGLPRAAAGAAGHSPGRDCHRARIDNEEREALVAEVGKLAGARIDASFKLDASILGGTVVRIGSTVYDGSVRGRLDRLKEALIAG